MYLQNIWYRILILSVALFLSSRATAAHVSHQLKCNVTVKNLKAEVGDLLFLLDEDGNKNRARVFRDRIKGKKVYAKMTRNCKRKWVGATAIQAWDLTKVQTSAWNRKHIRFGLGLEAGMAVAPMPMGGGYGSWSLSRDNALEFASSKGRLNFGVIAFEAQLTELRLKHFWSNSFYTNFGVGRRDLSMHSPLLKAFESDLDFSASVSSIVGSVALGNKWQWKSFHLGSDWIGSTFSIYQLSSKLGQPIDDSEEARREYNQRKAQWETLGRAVTAQLLRVYMGWSF